MKKKTLVLFPILLGIGVGVGLGLGSLSKPDSKQKSNPNEISINYDDDVHETEDPATETAFNDGEIIIDSDDLLPAAPLDYEHNHGQTSQSSPKVAASTVPSRMQKPETPQKVQTVNKPKQEIAASESTESASVTTAKAEQPQSQSKPNPQTSGNNVSHEDIQSDISASYVNVTPDQIAADYKKRLPIRVGKYQTLTDFTYSKKDGFTYHIRTNRDDITDKMKTSLPDYACGNKQVQIFMQYAEKVNFRFSNVSDVHLHTVTIPKSVCTSKLKSKYSSGSSKSDKS